MADIVRRTAEILMTDAADLTKEPLLACGSLLLAAGSACALAKIPYSEVAALLASYYEAVLLAESAIELGPDLTRIPTDQIKSN